MTGPHAENALVSGPPPAPEVEAIIGELIAVSVRTALEGRATMTVEIDRAAPQRIRRLGILVGGD